MKAELTNRWVVLAILFVVGLTAPVHYQAVAALAPFLRADVGLNYTDIGLMTGLFMMPGVVLAGPMGPISAWIGDRMTLIIGIALVAASASLFALSDDYMVMIACRIVGGAGAVAATALLPKMINDWFAGKEIATAMAIIASAVGLGIGLAMAGLPILATAMSWRWAMHAAAGACTLAIALLLLVYRDVGDVVPAVGKGGKPARILWRIDSSEFILSALAGVGRGLFSSGYSVFMMFIPPLVIARGMSAVDAGMLTSVAALISIVSVPLGGYLSDRTGRPGLFIVGGSLLSALMCVLVTSVTPVILWVGLFGAFRGGCTGGLMSLPSRVLKPQSRNTGFAVVSTSYFVCMTAFPPVGGYLLDVTGNTAAPLLFAALLWFSISILLSIFKWLERRWIGVNVLPA